MNEMFSREIQRLLLALLVAFASVTLISAYWMVTGDETVLTRDDNPRRVEEIARILRGGLYDQDDEALATSTLDEDGHAQRTYESLAASSATGYYSARYGTTGAEAAYDALLTGAEANNFSAWFDETVLHRPQTGQDVRLTIDRDVQTIAAEAMQGHTGALVIVHVPTGAIAALVSNPTFDPNTIDADWDALTADPGQPFFNRALQATYQPGDTVYNLMVLTALIEQFPGDTAFTEATRVVEAGNVALDCVSQPPGTTLTIFDAYSFGCPAPFMAFLETIGAEAVESTLRLMRPGAIPTLEGFAETISVNEIAGFTQDDAVGQGDFRVTPLEMALLIASFINNGNAPEPYALSGTREQGTEQWTPVNTVRQSTPITTPENARRMSSLLIQSVARGTAQAAATDGLEIGGQAALAYTGDQTLTWFVGFVRQENRRGYAIALVLEDTTDLDLAAEIGGRVLQAAVND